MERRIIKESSHGYNGLEVTDILLTGRKVFIANEITTDVCNDIIKQLLVLDSESSDEITVFITSPGGSISDGMALYDVIRMLRSPVKTICMGMSASMGAILLLAADERLILKNSEIMIHDPSFGSGKYAGKKPHEIQQQLDILTRTRDILCNIIAERTGRDIAEIREKTVTDSYFNAEEAIEFGLATRIAEPSDL